MNTRTYLTNCNPSKPNGELILEHVYNSKPHQLGHMKMFGCLAYIHISKMKRGKLDPQTLCGIFVGYDDVSKAYIIYNPQNQKIMIM